MQIIFLRVRLFYFPTTIERRRTAAEEKEINYAARKTRYQGDP